MDPDLLFAWTLAMNIDAPFTAGDEQAAQAALDAHLRPGSIRARVLFLVSHMQGGPARIAATAAAAWARHAEMTGRGEPPPWLRHYLVAAALAEHDPAARQQVADKISAGNGGVGVSQRQQRGASPGGGEGARRGGVPVADLGHAGGAHGGGGDGGC